jgi:oxygen-independent coproporphyrinogen-3 oxidase
MKTTELPASKQWHTEKVGAPRSAYLHVPFCARRCGYCNFTLVAGRDDLVERYLQAIEIELSWLGGPHEVDTLFFGGGTPSYLPHRELKRLLGIALAAFPLAQGAEFSVEANPADLDVEKVRLLAEHGVTRISLGGQSFDPRKLAVLERDHGAHDIRKSVELARDHVASVSCDLIFGVPGETLDVWRADLASVLELSVDHVSTYGLTFEKGTSFWGRLQSGGLARVEEDVEREMYALGIDTLTAAGFEHYEVSNFARPGRRCRHNEAYWLGESYFAAGPGAARYVAGRREINHRSTTTYLRRVLSGQSPVADSEELAPDDRARELLVFALRRLAGVRRSWFSDHTGFELDQLVSRQLARHVELGLMSDDGERVQLTREGLYVSDGIWPEYLNADRQKASQS